MFPDVVYLVFNALQDTLVPSVEIVGPNFYGKKTKNPQMYKKQKTLEKVMRKSPNLQAKDDIFFSGLALLAALFPTGRGVRQKSRKRYPCGSTQKATL